MSSQLAAGGYEMNNHEKHSDAEQAGVPGIPEAGPESRQNASEAQLLNELKAYRLELDVHKSKLHEAQRCLEGAGSLIFSVLENIAEGIMITDVQGTILSVNPAFERITGYAAEEAVSHTPALLKSGHHDENFYRKMWNALNEHGQWQGEIWNQRKNGEIRSEWLSIDAVRDSQKRVTHYVGIFSDAHNQTSVIERLRYLAYYDGLTGLPNRQLFLERLRMSLSQAQRNGHMLAIMFVDIDQFKQINDTWGHRVGDGLLVAVTARMKGCLRDSDTLARLGGDEFTVILPSIPHPGAASNVAEKFMACYAEPLDIEGKSLRVTASIGIVIFPDDGEDADSLLHHADVAMYRVKETGRNGYLCHDSEMGKSQSRMMIRVK